LILISKPRVAADLDHYRWLRSVIVSMVPDLGQPRRWAVKLPEIETIRVTGLLQR